MKCNVYNIQFFFQVVTGMLHTFIDKMLYTKLLINLTYENSMTIFFWHAT